MMNFLFSAMCACGAVFGALLTYRGATGGDYEVIIAGGIFLFGSLVTFGIGQIHRLMRAHRKQSTRAARRTEPVWKPEPAASNPFARGEPEALPARPEPLVPNPVPERVASRFARGRR